MAVVEYKHHVYTGDHRRHIPGFIISPDQWYNPQNHSFVGWVKEDADYYVPWSTLKVLSKEDFVQRCFSIHAIKPIFVPDTENVELGLAERVRQLTSLDEVRLVAEKWYDDFVTTNSSSL